VLFCCIQLFVERIARDALIEFCVKQRERNIGDSKGAGEEKEVACPTKDEVAARLKPMSFGCRHHGRTSALPIAVVLEGTE
jgi:hypothetical protein